MIVLTKFHHLEVARVRLNLAGRVSTGSKSGSLANCARAPNFGSQASAWLHNSADYVERMEPKKIKDDIAEQVRRNPGKSLLVASAVGLILGAIFRRK
jgi:ElaB/YqjD/DUF883 family membrane-anchored ribosome-binding protein